MNKNNNRYNEALERLERLEMRYNDNRHNELEERFEMAVEGFLKDHPQLINQEVIDKINDDGDGLMCYLECIFGYFDVIVDEEGGIDFGEYVLLNGYFSEADEDKIKKYVNTAYNAYDDYDNYDDLDNLDDLEYEKLINIKDKLNYFSGIICFQTNMCQIINNEYLNRNNEVYLK